MISSFYIFLAAMIFIMFGYLSLLRILYKQFFGCAPSFENFKNLNPSLMIMGLGHSAVFVSILATSLLLFWGWGAALLWLIIFHLLAETTINFQLSSSRVSITDVIHAKAPDTVSDRLIKTTWQIYLVLVISVTITLLSSLIDKQSGLLFALIGLLLAQRIYRSDQAVIPSLIKLVLAMTVMVAGLIFSNRLSFVIHGAFNPLEPIAAITVSNLFSWLSFNNTTLIALGLCVSGLVLAKNSVVNRDLNIVSGVLTLTLLTGLMVAFGWNNPTMEAPLNSIQFSKPELPWFSSLCLFMFAGLSIILLTSNNQHEIISIESDEKEIDAFSHLQSISLVHLALLLLLILSLGSITGVGSWMTHYLDWSSDIDIQKYFDLIVASTHKMLTSSSNSHLARLSTMLFMSGLMLIGFTFLLNLLRGLLADQNNDDRSTFSRYFVSTKIPHLIAIYILSCWLLSHGISVNLWIIIGMLAWLLVTSAITQMAVSDKHRGNTQLIQSSLCLLFILLGSIQAIATIVSWSGEQYWLGCFTSLSIFVIGILLWYRHIPTLIGNLKASSSTILFKK